jgi:glc operon protein GlcG
MRKLTLAAAAMLLASAAEAQAPPPIPNPAAPPLPGPPPQGSYGPPITLEQARMVIAAVDAEAARRKTRPSVAIVEPSGVLVYYYKATDAYYGLEEFALKKAKAAARNRRPTRYDMERYAAGMTALSTVEDIFPFTGGEPIVHQGKVIGGIGLTGSPFDEELAKVGAAALK